MTNRWLSTSMDNLNTNSKQQSQRRQRTTRAGEVNDQNNNQFVHDSVFWGKDSKKNKQQTIKTNKEKVNAQLQERRHQTASRGWWCYLQFKQKKTMTKIQITTGQTTGKKQNNKLCMATKPFEILAETFKQPLEWKQQALRGVINCDVTWKNIAHLDLWIYFFVILDLVGARSQK